MRLDVGDWLDGLEGLAYFVGPSGAIVACGERNWRRFALENGAPELADASAVVGRNILDFVEGDEVRDAYRGFLDTLLNGESRAISFLFRCDAPNMRRDLRMGMSVVRSRGETHGVLFHSTTLKTTTRLPARIFDFKKHRVAASAPEDPRAVRMCSFCQKLAGPGLDPSDSENWVDGSRYGGAAAVQAPIRHSVCPPCHRQWVDILLPRGSGKRLTPRQIDILRQLCQGHSNKIIAYRLGTTENTVKTHLKEIFKRIGARNRAEAVRLAFKTWPDFKET
jgi:DNA-binding CsgD family transcriptional regulator